MRKMQKGASEMKIQDFKEGIYINKDGRDIVEIVFKFMPSNRPLFIGDDFSIYSRINKLSSLGRLNYFMENYVFCCEL